MNGSKPDSSLETEALDIWQFSTDVSNRLLLWNVVNILVGLLIGRGRPFMRGLASQHVGWGLINISIAVFGKRSSNRRYARLAYPYAADVQAKDTRNLRLLLAGNGFLDVLYVLGGLRLFRRAARGGVRGAGLGIAVQGALLFLFDWRMFRRSLYVRARDPETMRKRAFRPESI